jgi:hypothetical protein
MSLALQIRAGQQTYMTEPPDVAASGLFRLENRGYAVDVRELTGGKGARLGEERAASRRELIDAIDRLLAPARSLGSGFRVRARFYPGDKGSVGSGVGGILLNGHYFGIRCSEDYWEMHPSGPNSGPHVPLEMRGLRRYEPAEFHSENMGIVKVQRKRGGRKALVDLLIDLKRFLQDATEEVVQITVG